MITDTNITTKLIKLTEINYPLFANYCKLLDMGMRKDALKSLDKFMNDTQNWDYTTKSTFCKTIFSVSKSINDFNFILTHNLTDNLVKPTLIEMTIKEPNNFCSFKWYGQYFGHTKYIKKAHELNPSDNSIKLILLNMLDNDIWSSIHHLPEGYIGDIEEDEQDLKLAFSLLKTLDTKMKGDFLNRFTDYKNVIEEYKQNNPVH